MLVAVGAKLQRVCESDGSDADKLHLDYDQVTATLNVSLVDRKNAVFTSYKIHLSADWNRTQVDEKACQDAHFYPHSEYDIHLKNVWIQSLNGLDSFCFVANVIALFTRISPSDFIMSIVDFTD